MTHRLAFSLGLVAVLIGAVLATIRFRGRYEPAPRWMKVAIAVTVVVGLTAEVVALLTIGQ